MPGIYGTLSSAGVPSDEIGRMLDSVRHYDWYSEEHWSTKEIRIAALSLPWGGGKLYADSETGDFAALAGEIYDAAAVRRQLATDGARLQKGGQAELCLHGFKQQGSAFFAGLNGNFAIAIWQAVERRLTIVVDRFGMRPCYYLPLPDGLAFASEITALLAGGRASPRPNAEAIATFFAYRQYVGGATMIEGVRRLPPASALTFEADRNRCRLDRYWDLRSLAASPLVGDGIALDRIERAFAASVKRCADGTEGLGLSLSGGLDSRTIMAAVSPAQPLSCVTLGIPGSMDLRLAQQLAERSGRAFHACILDAEFLRHYEHHFRRMVRLIEAQTLAIGITVPTIDLYRQLGTRVLLRGHAGELMHMHRAYSCSLDDAAFAVRDEDGLEDWAVHHLAAPVFAEPGLAFLTPRYRALVEPVARAALHEILADLAGVEPLVHRFWLLFVRHLLPGAVAPSIAKFGTVVETRVPYIDADLIAALLSAAPALKLRDDVQSHILRRHAPALLAVPDSNTGAPLGATPARVALSAFAKRLLAKLGVAGYQPYERLGLWLRQEAREFVERILLSEQCLDRGVLERDAVRTAIHDHAAKRRNNTYSILTMLSFELGQREFFDQGSALQSLEQVGDPARSGVAAN